jgi:hypothetical protein
MNLPTLNIRNLGQIKEASLSFGDLTVFVGPQATGKSIALQLLKLMVDADQIQGEISREILSGFPVVQLPSPFLPRKRNAWPRVASSTWEATRAFPIDGEIAEVPQQIHRRP